MTRMHLSAVAMLALAGAPLVSQAAPTKRQSLGQGVLRGVLEALYPKTWDDDATVGTMEKVVSTAAAHPIADVVVRRWISLANQPGSSPAVWRKLRARLDDARLHGTARHNLRGALTQWLYERGDFKASDAASPLGEYWRACLAIGPFGDLGGDAYGVRYAPEDGEIALDARRNGRFGRLRWRRAKARPRSTRIDLAPRGVGRLHGRGCHYALFQVESQEARVAWLQFYCAGSFQLWWNDGQDQGVYRRLVRKPASVYVPVALRKGWNRLLVKTTSEFAATVAVRPVDAVGAAIKGLSIEAKRVLHPVADAAAGEARPAAFEDAVRAVERVANTAGASAEALALAANLVARDARRDVAVSLAQAALKKAPDDPTIRAAVLDTWRLARHIPADLIRSKIRQLLAIDKEQWHGHRALFVAKVDRMFADDKHEEALRELDAMIAKHPKSIPLVEQKQRLLARMRWTGEARRAYERLAILAPNAPRYALGLAAIESREGNPAAALARIEAALAERPGHRGLTSRALGLSRRVGDQARADKYLAMLYRGDPHGYLAASARAAALSDAGKYSEAVATLEPWLERRPESAALFKRVGEQCQLAGDEPKALRYYRRSLTLDPQQHELRSWVLHVAGVEEFPACKAFQLDAMSEVAAFKKRPEDDQSPSTLVLDQMVVRVYPDGSQMEETHVLRRINDRRGVEQFEDASQAAQASELLELRTIQPDGTWAAPHRVAGTFSMPRLVPGTFLEEHYRNYKSSPGLKPIDFVRFTFASVDKPYRFSRLVVLLPNGHDLGHFVRRNFPESEVQRRELDGLTAWIFLKKDMKKIEQEVHMPPVEELAPSVTFGKERPSAPFVRARRTWFQQASRPYLEIVEKTKAVVGDASSDREKARRIHRFVHALTPDPTRRSGSPAPVSVLLKREGDRFFLQLSMLRAAGVRWRPALIHPVPPDLDPNPEPFLGDAGYYSVPAAIVQPRDGDSFWIVRGTPRYYPFAKLPPRLGRNPIGGCPYLDLVGDVGIPGRMPGANIRELTGVRVKAEAKIDGTNVRLDAYVEFPGPDGFALKEQLRSLNKSRQGLAGRQLAGMFFRGFTVERSKLRGIEVDGQPLSLQLRLARKNFLERDGQTFGLPPLLQARRYTKRFAGRPHRVHPFVFSALDVREWTVTIDPGKLRFQGQPSGLFERRMLIDYGLSYELIGNRLRVRRRSIVRPGRVPADRYAEFLDLCRRIDNVESRRLRLK